MAEARNRGTYADRRADAAEKIRANAELIAELLAENERLGAIINAAPQPHCKWRKGESVRHVETGPRLYRIEMTPDDGVFLTGSGTPCYVYVSDDGVNWVMSQVEMEDGRFVAVEGGEHG